MKNLPDLAEGELTQMLTEKLSQFGKITSILVRKDPQIQKPFAFVCFQEAEQAQLAFNFLENNSLNNSSDPKDKIYVNWAQTRFERNRKLRELYNQMQNETNLYLKNLKSSLTKEQVQAVFSTYGEVTSCEVKMPASIPEYKPNLVPTKFAFINFKEKEDAKKALINSKYNQQVLELFDDPKNLYITYHVKKNRLNTLQQIKSR